MKGFFPSLLLALIVAFLSSCVSQRDRPPQRDGYVVHTYHYCEKCETLQGGVYEKGPFKKFPGPTKDTCVHDWQEVSRNRFIQLATELYDVDWSKETANFWNPEGDNASPNNERPQ